MHHDSPPFCLAVPLAFLLILRASNWVSVAHIDCTVDLWRSERTDRSCWEGLTLKKVELIEATLDELGGEQPVAGIEVTIRGVRYRIMDAKPPKTRSTKWRRRKAEEEEPKWRLAASGALGVESVTIPLGRKEDASYTVRLCFAEPENFQAGQRVFDISVQGKPVFKDFDIVKEAGGPNRIVVKETQGVEASDQLQVTLKANAGKTLICGIQVLLEEKL